MNPDTRTALNNEVLPAWERAMESFYEAVEKKQGSLSDKEVAEALAIGYGDEASEGWLEWVAGTDL